MTSPIDNNYFQELAKATPSRICRQNRCRFDPVSKRYSLDIWGEEYVIDCTAGTIERTGNLLPKPHEYFYLFIICYLLSAQDTKVSGEWISEKDLPGGVTFFRGPHVIPTELISGRFGNDLEKFTTWCTGFGGISMNMADAAFRFEISADIPLAILYWQGDEDFPAEAKILYDRSITTLLPLDIIFALAVAVCTRLGKTNPLS